MSLLCRVLVIAEAFGVLSLYLAILCTQPFEDPGSSAGLATRAPNSTLSCWTSGTGTIARPPWDRYHVGGFGGVVTDVLLVWLLRAALLLLAPVNPYLLRTGLLCHASTPVLHRLLQALHLRTQVAKRRSVIF